MHFMKKPRVVKAAGVLFDANPTTTKKKKIKIRQI